MYFRASCVELPSWLIDMRHKISHDKDLPTLQSLRVAMEFALEWLQVKKSRGYAQCCVIIMKLF